MGDAKASTKNKTLLSHTVSLPVTSSVPPPLISKGSVRRSNRTSVSSNESVPAVISESPNEKKSAGKSWSFGTMAKAVGCGVTAFGSGVVHTGVAVGSGVVQGTKVVGTGVVQGTKAVGSGVVQGTMVAGQVTKDVTLAAGKNVYQAGEKVGTAAATGVNVIKTTTAEVGKELSSASVSAVQDTTKWMMSRTESLLGECTIHVILPDETLEEVARMHDVNPQVLIRANNLSTRRVRVGREIMVPSPADIETVLHLQHDMSQLEIAAIWFVTNDEDDENAERIEVRGRIKLTCEEIVFLPDSSSSKRANHTHNSSDSDSEDSSSSSSASSVAGVQNNDLGVESFNLEMELIHLRLDAPTDRSVLLAAQNAASCAASALPELVPAHVLEERHFSTGEETDQIVEEEDEVIDAPQCEESRQSGGSATLVVEVEELLRQRHKAQQEEAAQLASKPKAQLLSFTVCREGDTTVTCYCDPTHMDQVLAHIDLWFPQLLQRRPLYRVDQEDQDDLMEGLSLEMTARSQVLTSRQLFQLHSKLPAKTQSDRWHLAFSSHFDGYSLANFYRKVSEREEPMLLVFRDDEDNVFGAYLTCVPQICEGFIGTGKSWLFSFSAQYASSPGASEETHSPTSAASASAASGSNSELTVFPWAGENEYFFQGRPNDFVIGAEDGQFGIYMDGDLNKGHLGQCSTFKGWPPGQQERDFTLKYFECWNFM